MDNMSYTTTYNRNYDLSADQINIDGGTLHRDSVSPSVDSNPAWDIMDIMNNVKVSSLQTFILFVEYIFYKKGIAISTFLLYFFNILIIDN